MQLKTYRAHSMNAALAEVKKDLGPDAVILHTRTYKSGGMLGMGAKPVVEITASTGSHPQQARRRPARTAAPVAAGAGAGGGFTPASFDRVELGATATATREAEPTMRPTTGPTPGPLPESDTAQPISTEPKIRPAPGFDDGAAKASDGNEPDPDRPGPHVVPEPADRTPRRDPEPARRVPTVRAPLRPASGRGYAALEAELASIKRMVGQVLRSSRDSAGGGLGVLPEPLFELYNRLVRHDVLPELADALAGEVRDELDLAELADERCVRDSMIRAVARRMPTADVIGPSSPRRVIALVGPTGVGKTTTVAKLAASFKLRQGKRVGLVTSDTYRIAAVEQLRTYAEIIGLPLKVAITPGEMRSAVAGFADCDVVMIDTAGRSQNDTRRLDELGEFLDAGAPDERHLVLSSTISQTVMADAAERFAVVAPDRLIVTKMDEAVCHGPVLNTADRVGLPFSYVTTGQEVPDHIETATSERIAAIVVDGRSDG